VEKVEQHLDLTPKMRVSAAASSFVSRSVARQAFLNQQRAVAGRRFQSSAPEQKAQDALATAKNYAGKFFEATKKFLGPVGDKAGQLLGCTFIFLCTQCVHLSYTSRASAYKQPLLYNLAVTKEVFKQIYVKEGLRPPTLEEYRTAYTSLWTQVTKPGFARELVRSGDLGRVGIYGLQAYGIFKVSLFVLIVSRMPVLNRWLCRLEKLLDDEVWLATRLIIRATRGTGDQ
jgi:F-type H+-transporting ATPase subunit g